MTSEVRTPLRQRVSRLAGDRFGFYRVTSESPMTASELARRSGTSAAFVRDWVVAEAAGSYIGFDPRIGRYVNISSAPRAA